MLHMLLAFLLMPVLSRMQEMEPQGSSQDPCGELKQLRELVYQQAAMLSEMKVKMVYMEKEKAGEKMPCFLPSHSLSVSLVLSFLLS